MSLKKRIIKVVDYDPRWPAEFRKEARVISKALGVEISQIHHIGSTAVPGLRAKRVIDILLLVKDVGALDAYDARMREMGYIPKGEFGIPERRFYLKGLYDRTHHIHAFNALPPGEIDRHLAFRDYLIAHPVIAEEYGDLKAQCAEACDNDNEKYCALKNDFVVAHERLAVEWIESLPES